MKLTALLHQSPIGPLALFATPDALVTVVLRANRLSVSRTSARLITHFGGADEAGIEVVTREAPGPMLAAASAELDAYFEGSAERFTVPLDQSLSSGFELRVLQLLHERVPYGATTSYGELAAWAGEPAAARAVGTAMGANPLPIVVPCHRVVESDGGLGGFGGGREMKRQLLELEGILPRPLF